MLFSPSTNGFYDEAIHGLRRISIVDPAWIHPQVERVITNTETGDVVDRWMEDDPNISAPTIEINNPDCTIPADAVEIPAELHTALLDGQSQGLVIEAGPNGYPVLTAPPAPTLEQIGQQMTVAVQGWMDAAAKTHGYDNLLSAISYADEPAVPRFQADGLAFRAWRSLVWAKCHELLAEVKAGTRATPTEAELLTMLPEAPL